MQNNTIITSTLIQNKKLNLILPCAEQIFLPEKIFFLVFQFGTPSPCCTTLCQLVKNRNLNDSFKINQVKAIQYESLM